MEPNFALPDQLRYNVMTPSTLSVWQETAVVSPYTGSASLTVASGNYFIINIPKSGNDAVFDPLNSYLCFKLTFTDTSNTANVSMALSCSAHCIFRRLDVYHGSS